mgnify:CR=1 FL=1
MSQAAQVLRHLNAGRKITSVEAFGLYGITRLAAVVHNLKKDGVDIRTTMQDGIRAKYAEYKL